MSTPPPQALVNYAVRHVTVKTNGGSRQYMDHGYELKLRTVPSYNLIHCTRGKLMWVVDGVEHPLDPGSLVIVPPDTPHFAYSRTQRITLGSIHVEARLPGGQDLFQMLQPRRQQEIPFNTPLDVYLRGAAMDFTREVGRQMIPFWGELIVRELFMFGAQHGLLDCRVGSVVPNGRTGHDVDLVLAMLEDLDKRIDQPVTLSELAKRAGFSAQHLNRVFREVLGVTPLQYLARTRMERAATLLRNDELTVSAVGKRVGFDDPYYFSRVFSQHFKKSPAQYRAGLLS